MKSAVAAMGLFAVMANAYHHPRHFHFRRDNTTASADAGLTTLTVIATQVSTITSCAPTVISCPAKQTDIATLPESDKITQVVTNTVILTETVCPVSEVPAISSSVISEADAGSITGTTLTAPQTASVPLSTGVPATTSAASPGEPGEPSNPSLTTTEHVETKSLTITLGTGTDKSTVTSTYLTTVIQTVTCDGGCGGSGSNGGNGGNDKTEEPTTTTTATTTGTTTVTVPNPSATENGTPGGSNGNGTPGNGNGNGEGECQPTATVTVTAPASTVYVTVGAEASKTEAAESAPSVTGVVDEDEDDEEDDYEDDDECEIDTTTTLQTTVTVQPSSTLAPFPTGNNGTSGAAAPTGYARLRY